MFRRIFDAFNFVGTEEPVPRRTVVGADRDDGPIDEDGWICFDMPTQSYNYYDKDDFELIDNPEILEVGDDTMLLFGVGTAEEIKRREIYNLAKAKTALRNNLESVMFADPESGKDTRIVKSTRESPHKAVVCNKFHSIRRLSFKSQRAKSSSGKSNDRKTHRACVLKLTET